MRTPVGTILVAIIVLTCVVGAAGASDPIPVHGMTSTWRPSVRWRGFNLLGMFCQSKMKNGEKRIFGCFPEDRFLWMEEWGGGNFARLPLDYRFFVEKDDWMKPVESQLVKLDDAVRLGKKHGIHVQISWLLLQPAARAEVALPRPRTTRCVHEPVERPCKALSRHPERGAFVQSRERARAGQVLRRDAVKLRRSRACSVRGDSRSRPR